MSAVDTKHEAVDLPGASAAAGEGVESDEALVDDAIVIAKSPAMVRNNPDFDFGDESHRKAFRRAMDQSSAARTALLTRLSTLRSDLAGARAERDEALAHCRHMNTEHDVLLDDLDRAERERDAARAERDEFVRSHLDMATENGATLAALRSAGRALAEAVRGLDESTYALVTLDPSSAGYATATRAVETATEVQAAAQAKAADSGVGEREP